MLCSFFLIRQTFDIRIFDTFYVTRLKYLYWVLAGSMFVYWTFYRFALMPLFSEKLINLHIFLTMLVCVLIVVFHISSGQLYIWHSNLDFYDVLRFQKNNLILTILLLGLGAVQGIFTFNFLWSLNATTK